MEKKMFKKKLLILLMIISIVATDFFVLGSSLNTYADQINTETNNPNVEFSAYFKNELDERVDSIEKSIKSQDLKIYAEIIVKNEGYLNEGTTIEIENSNFNIKDNILSDYIKTIEGNKVVLKQITAGENIEIPLDIEPIILDKMPIDMLSQISTVKLNGTYTGSAEGGIQYGQEVCMTFLPNETAEAELQAEIITNTVQSVEEVNKRIVQLSIKSRLSENQYPVEQTTLDISIPELSVDLEEVNVMAIGNLATNGETEISEEDFTLNGYDLQIILKNEVDANNEITWLKDAYDELVVTFIYAEDVDASSFEINTDSEIKLYNIENTYTKTELKPIEAQEQNSIIMTKTEITTEEMYKGQIYANIDAQYETKTTLVVTNTDVADQTIIYEEPDRFGTDEGELQTNTKYITTEINLEKALTLLGQEGTLEIKNGETTTTINKDTEVNEQGNVVINHEDSDSYIYISTSKPENIGTLEIYHTKEITENDNYTREELQTVKTLNASSKVAATLEGIKILENATETATIELKETISKAELTIIDKEDRELSTTVDTNEVSLGVTLVTSGPQYDLYSNPIIRLELPQAVDNVTVSNIQKLYDDQGYFEEPVGNIKEENGQKILEITLNGEQTEYQSEQLYLQIDLSIKISEIVPTQTDKITMKYKNNNATQYADGGTVFGITEQEVTITSTPGLVKMFNLSLNENTSLTEDITQLITGDDETLPFEAILINNTDTDINNVKILGKLPTTGNNITGQENTFETILESIDAPNATTYYTENVDATADIENATNGWTADLATLTNAKLYLIKIDTLAKADIYTATINVEIPKPIHEDVVSYTQYEVTYDETEIAEKSRTIGLMTSLLAGIETSLTAQIGGQDLLDGMTVKEGEVIRYTSTVTNNTGETLEEIELKTMVPEGTVLVEPVKALEIFYFEEKDDKEIKETFSLDDGEVYTKTYEVRVNTDITAGTEISNTATVTYNNLERTKELKNKLEESNVRVTIKSADDEGVKLVSGGKAQYAICVENLSDEESLKNLKLQFNPENFKITYIKDESTSMYGEDLENEISITEIPVQGTKNLWIYGEIPNDIEKIDVFAIVTDSNGNYKSNTITQEFSEIEATITLASTKNNKEIKAQDKVTYNITVKNVGDSFNGTLLIKDSIPSYLKVTSITINGEVYWQTTDETKADTYKNEISNDISYSTTMEMESGQVLSNFMKIETEVQDIPVTDDGKVIANKAELYIFQVHEATSEEVTHILVNDSAENEKLKNIISGQVWIDKNVDGIKDSSESNLSGVNVKIYDISTNSYLDEEGMVIYQITDDKGIYSFTQIPNGSYIIVFDVDMEEYEPTIKEGTIQDSKASLKDITVNGENITVIGIELNGLQDNVANMNVGLKEITETPVTPENPGNDDETEDSNTETPGDTEMPGNTDESVEDTKTISGFAWLDENRNGQKDKNETAIAGIKVKVYDVSIKNYLTDNKGNVIEAITNTTGKYIFNNIEKGSYILIFEYDTEEYEPTTYLAEGVDTVSNSKIILKNINVNGKEITAAVTDIINVQDNISNINIGLKEKLIFDLELNKYISRVVVQTSKETKKHDYENATIAKVEIHRKQIEGALVVLEYTIKVKNTGEIAGYAKNIVDYLPKGLTFSSELNKDWYLSGNYLYTKGLENVAINPGEEKEIKLILTKTMTDENVGCINNRAEIYQDYNKYGNVDTDSTPNNQVQNEDDLGSVDVIIGISTGGNAITYIMLFIINLVLIAIAIKLMINSGIIKISIKKERR